MKSIRKTLSLYLLLAAITTAIVIGIATYWHTLNQNEELFDYQLRQIALSVRDQGVVPLQNLLDGKEDTPDFVVQIWTANGTVIYASRAGVPLLDRAVLGYADVDAGNRHWRVYSVAARGRIIQVAQPLDLRRDLIAAAALRSLIPLFAFIPLMALLIWWLVGASLTSVTRLARDVGQQDIRALNQVSEDGVPTEISPLIRALNTLLVRLRQAFSSQQEFVANAAHELRSPLTALKLQLQLFGRAADESTKETALKNLHEGVDRATHLIEQLLAAARTDPNDTLAQLQPTDLAELVRQVMADIFLLAQARNISIELQAPGTVMIDGEDNTLRILVRNLLDNAIRYAPQGGAVCASVHDSEAGVMLTVEDNGPGIPEDDRKRVFRRFYRGNINDQNGSGLGLAIVKNITVQHGAQVMLDQSSMGGLKVSILFKK